MPFFTFHQNKSGGEYKERAKHVIIEARNAHDANQFATELYDIYFDGCNAGLDCRRYGDRWFPVTDDDATEKPEIFGQKPDDIVESDSDVPTYVIYNLFDSWSQTVVDSITTYLNNAKRK